MRKNECKPHNITDVMRSFTLIELLVVIAIIDPGRDASAGIEQRKRIRKKIKLYKQSEADALCPYSIFFKS